MEISNGGEGERAAGGGGGGAANAGDATSPPSNSGESVGDILGLAKEKVWNLFFSSLANDDPDDSAGADAGGGAGDQLGVLPPNPLDGT